MKAAVRRNYCSPRNLKIEQIEAPVPDGNEILVKVNATTVNRTDCANLSAQPFIMRFFLGLFKPNKIILGTDFAGEVISLGKNVNSFNIGDKIFGFNDAGLESQAEFLTTIQKNIFPIPKNIDFKQAAAGLEGAHYAYAMVRRVSIQSGQSIFVNGATGGIGSALLQFVRQYDVKITATADTENINLIKNLGADEIIDYTKEDFTTKGGKYDFVFDTVGKSTFGKCKSLLNKNGVYISSELGPFAQNVFYPLFNAMRSKKVIFPIPYDITESIPYIISHLKKGSFIPVIDKEYPLENISKAYEYVVKGTKTGNVVINVIR